MKKIISSLLVLFIIALSLSSCGNKKLVSTFVDGNGDIWELYDDDSTQKVGKIDSDTESPEPDISVQDTSEQITIEPNTESRTENPKVTDTSPYGTDNEETVIIGTEPVNTDSQTQNTEAALTDSETQKIDPVVLYTVTYTDRGGLILDTVKVTKGENAAAFEAPAVEGYTFCGWNPSVESVQCDIITTAEYILNPGNNIIELSYNLCGTDTVEVYCSVNGTVKFAGCDIEIKIPKELTLESKKSYNGAVINRVGDMILIDVAKVSDIKEKADLVCLKFRFSDADKAVFDVNVKEIFDENLKDVEFSIIGKTLTLK